jgi:hypothetical protein
MTVLSDDPIRVFLRDGTWTVDYGRPPHTYHGTEDAAVKKASRTAHLEHRQLVIEPWPRTRKRSQWWSSAEPSPAEAGAPRG